MRITKDTKIITSLAAKQGNIGAVMYNAGFQALGVDFVYVPITTDDIRGAIAGVRGLKIAGSNVSMPHKQTVMQYLDRVDEIAKTIGAVNTISNQAGVLTGYNSDWVGATEALKEETSLEGKRVIVLGAGGTARAIVFGLKRHRAAVTILNRDAAKGAQLAQEFGATFGGGLDQLAGRSDYDVLVNSTSIGFGTEESPVPREAIKRGVVVQDVVFMPTRTALLKFAEERGCGTVPGYRMLIHQALFQFELYSGKRPPFDVLEEALLAVV